MPSIIKPKKDLMLRSAPLIDTLCGHIKKIGVTFFSHTRIFNDGSRIDLNNHPEMISEFYYGQDELYKIYTPEVSPQNLEMNTLFLDSMHDNKSIQFLRYGYNIDHMVAEVEKHQTHCDIWNFGTKPVNQKFYADYVANKGTIDLFKRYYLQKANRLIKACEDDRIIIAHKSTHSANSYLPANEAVNKHLWLDVKKDLLAEMKKLYGHNFQLTHSEQRYCHLIAQGLTRKQIAEKVFRSPKTIDAHIQNIKLKLNCKSVREMVTKLCSMGFDHYHF